VNSVGIRVSGEQNEMFGLIHSWKNNSQLLFSGKTEDIDAGWYRFES
jgi:hypothetical protein